MKLERSLYISYLQLRPLLQVSDSFPKELSYLCVEGRGKE